MLHHPPICEPEDLGLWPAVIETINALLFGLAVNCGIAALLFFLLYLSRL